MSVLIPTSLAEAVAALADDPSSMVLAGGTDVMVEINGGHRRPEVVIAVGRVPELRTWRTTPRPDRDTLRIGAGVTYAELEGEHFRTLGAGARPGGAHRRVAADPPRGTLGGNLATCSPAGDGLPVLAALDAIVQLVSATGTPVGAVRRVHGRPEAHRPAAGRADRRRSRCRCSPAGRATQGRRAQRDGDRQRRRVPGGRRRAVACAWRSARSARRSSAAPRPRRSPRSAVDFDDGRRSPTPMRDEFGRLAAAAAARSTTTARPPRTAATPIGVLSPPPAAEGVPAMG